MAEIRPFKGIRYNQSLVAELGAVITPPYDVIDSEEQERLHQRSPFNIIRLEYGKTYPDDDENNNRYTRAASTLQQWLDNQTVKADTEDSFYLYEQSFFYNSITYRRHGIIAALKLEPYSSRIVLPHELTMAGPKADRLKLLKKSLTNISPIFTLFPDPQNRMEYFFSRFTGQIPLIEAAEPSGQTHRLWAMTDPDLQAELSAYLEPQPLLIADGHHRYETALAFSGLPTQKGLPGRNHILSVLVSMKDPDLLMLPTHRLLNGLSGIQKNLLTRHIDENFTSVDLGEAKLIDYDHYTTELKALGSDKKCFGYLTTDQACLLVPKAEISGDPLPVSLLHDILLKPVLQTEEGSEAVKGTLGFSHDFASTLDAVFSGAADAAFILDTIPVDEVLERARQGMIMPQKSTYFYPKLPGGLVLRHMELS
jgi:uncharacterized protein (DUF1015 family)